MLIDNDCIIILNNSVCQEFLNNEITFEIVQCVKPYEPKANCFIQASSVIQCINPSSNGDDNKLKLSVVYKPSALYRLEYAAVVFSRKLDCSLEVRRKNEITLDTNFSSSALVITSSDEDGKLNMDFSNKSDKIAEISEMISEINSGNNQTVSEIHTLEENLAYEKKKCIELCEKKESVVNEIEKSRKEIEEINDKFNELKDITAQKELLEKNLKDNSENAQKAEAMKKELSYYSEILNYYKNDDGYFTVSQRLDDLKIQISDIKDHIAVLAQKRTDEINRITDELNI